MSDYGRPTDTLSGWRTAEDDYEPSSRSPEYWHAWARLLADAVERLTAERDEARRKYGTAKAMLREEDNRVDQLAAALRWYADSDVPAVAREALATAEDSQ